MSVRRFDQMLAGFADGDAISAMAVSLRDLFRRWGLHSDIYTDARHVSPSLRDACRPLEAYDGGAGDVLFHHYSIGSPALDRFVAAPGRKILIYHNITPAEFFQGYDDRVAAQLRDARARLPGIGQAVHAVWAVSSFNATELQHLGLREVKVLPLFFQPQDLPNDPEVEKRFRRPLTTVLSVGRVAPNKNLEFLIEAFAWYHCDINPQSRLVIVGSERSCPRYFAMLRMLAGDLNLPAVGFEGFASPAGLQTYYRCANVFVAPSRHEGFCLPLLEAMHVGVPVIAHEVGGIPEALGGAGVMYRDVRPVELAGLIERVVSAGALRDEVLVSQRQRLDALRRRDVEGEVRALVQGLLP